MKTKLKIIVLSNSLTGLTYVNIVFIPKTGKDPQSFLQKILDRDSLTCTINARYYTDFILNYAYISKSTVNMIMCSFVDSSSPANLKRKHPDSDPLTSTPQHSDPPRMSLTPLHDAPLPGMRASSTPIESHHRHHSESRTTPLYADSRGETKRAAVSKDFAHEFHESVLQTTRQQQESRAGVYSHCVVYSIQFCI